MAPAGFGAEPQGVDLWRFMMLGKVTVGLFFLLLVWGNLVAGMEAGLGCPDWPLCHGRVVPPLALDTYMEFLHRVIAAAATVSLVLLSYNRFKVYRGKAKAVPVVAVGLVLIAVVLGGMVVLLGLPGRLITVHFAIALSVFLLSYYMMHFDGVKNQPAFPANGPALLFISLGAVVFFQAVLGAYVRHSEAGLACPDFPSCLGSLIPPVLGGKVLLHFTHRLLAYLIFLTMAALFVVTITDGRMKKSQGGALMLMFLVLGQIAVGAVVVRTGLYYVATALHLAVALAILTVLTWMWTGEARAEEARP